MSERKTPSRRQRRAAGFTLLELLVAITLLGLIAVMLAGGLRLGARVWERGQEHAEDLAQLEVVQGFLRRQLSQAYPLRLTDADAPARTAFQGRPEALRFAVLAPPQFGFGGFYLLTVDLEEGDEGGRLRLSARAYHPEMEEQPREGEVRESVLLERVAAVEFAYFGAQAPDEPPLWQDRWEGDGERVSELPALVRLRLAFGEGDGRYWPELIVAPRISR